MEYLTQHRFELCCECEMRHTEKKCFNCHFPICEKKKCSMEFPHYNMTNINICSSCCDEISEKFKQAHGDLCDPEMWIQLQELNQSPDSGEFFPYSEQARFNLPE